MKLSMILTVCILAFGFNFSAHADSQKQAGVNVWTYMDGTYIGKAQIKTEDGKKIIKTIKAVVKDNQLTLSPVQTLSDDSVLHLSNGAIKNKNGEVVGACQSYVCTYIRQGLPIDGVEFAGNMFSTETIIFGNNTIHIQGKMPVILVGNVKDVPDAGYKRLNGEIAEGPSAVSIIANLKLVKTSK